MNAIAPDALNELENALQEERRALLENDVEALLRSTQAKLAAVRVLQGTPAVAPVDRVTRLNELNQANHVLLTRRRREVNWALRHLGRVESAGVYDASGQPGARPQARCLGVG
ncbi:flagellar protein FlgN [Lysobacter korlensis]|uniref:Flagellar protein FlgN n=1 Tax=Lysobacter korlensis TaxID=553636 RepID=A0ABV6RJD9_9GAMM